MISYVEEYKTTKADYLALKQNQQGGKNKNVLKFDKWLKNNFKNCWDIPGLAITIFNSKNVLYSKAFGYANIKTKRKLKITDKFCIASCSKSILCLAITLAIKAKDIPDLWKMNLSDVFEKTNRGYHNVPIKYLACHTSGISDICECPKFFQKYSNMEGTKSRKLIANHFIRKAPCYEPNSNFQYSNVGYGILGHIAEKYCKCDYMDMIDKYVFKPLNIKAEYRKYYIGEGYAEGHKIDRFLNDSQYEPLKEGEHINPTYEEPSGEIYINALDSAKYMQQYLLANKNEKGLFDKKTYDLQTTPIKNSYGLGLMNTEKTILHGGGYFYTSTFYVIYPKKDIGIIINCNTFGFPLNAVTNKFDELFIDA